MAEDAKFRTATIKAIIESALADQNDDQKLRIPPTTVELIAEYLRCVVVEATERAVDVAGDEKVIDESHLEKILPQLLLDIS
ncbi:hypothetical protein TVAG_408150 [Trichomonas vaginalis G3]|uniref:Centromere protein X n=1 Tax=Trichomonas vaginalis (strain ATCC PRA-98 / G3) TaxID=412133 RepID=A2FX12_TRIV3|nr:CENP-S associating centromere protein X family [Trichomonas vaginalis G3]EAX90560.1 hypothetical protein TVAG_408150 [Trichomonas vaginalis G3]KAI5542905.1 CENP-S associating centromere protein X family [Trichomonas vaginalis G3]|eukprot:XP_001303490.1 hypothetical protein [Trichomonas vaginalis G3]